MISRFFLVFWFGALLQMGGASSEEATCEAGDETCVAGSSFDEWMCSKTSSIYGVGGSAQAYSSGAPLADAVCRPDMARDFRYRPASWPMSRRSFRKGTAADIDVVLNIQSCQSLGDSCVCHSLSAESAKSASSVVEIWQTRPDGTYSPLRQRVNGSIECRAQVPIGVSGTAEFSTVAPGSTGIMGGLGPGGWDLYPYGEPVIHLLVRAAGHSPVLLDVPILYDISTLEPTSFWMSDFRGTGWVRKKENEPPMKVRSWKGDVQNNRISLELDIFVQPANGDQVFLCESYIFGFPSSFFLEPMSVCAPSMLDFFAL